MKRLINPLSYYLLLILCLTQPVLAENSSDEDIQIRANFMQYDMKTSSSIYTGDVHINQGTISITGDKVIIKRTEDELRMIEITGQPARFEQDDGNTKVEASSEKMIYAATRDHLTLIEKAQLKQADRIVESQRIVYNTSNQSVTAGSNKKESNNRVNITLTPVKDAPADDIIEPETR